MNPIGYYYSTRNHPDRTPPAKGAATASIVDRAGRDHDMAMGVLLMTTVVGVPILLTAIFLLLFRL